MEGQESMKSETSASKVCLMLCFALRARTGLVGRWSGPQHTGSLMSQPGERGPTARKLTPVRAPVVRGLTNTQDLGSITAARWVERSPAEKAT